MANTKNTEAVAAEQEEMITPVEETEAVKEAKPVEEEEMITTMFIKDNGKYKDDIHVQINGKVWSIQRGVEVTIPKNVYEVIVWSMKADAEAADHQQELQDSSNFAKE